MGQSQSFQSIQDNDFQEFCKTLSLDRLSELEKLPPSEITELLREALFKRNFKGHLPLHRAVCSSDWRFTAHVLAFASIGLTIEATATKRRKPQNENQTPEERRTFPAEGSRKPNYYVFPSILKNSPSTQLAFKNPLENLLNKTVTTQDHEQLTSFLLACRKGNPIVVAILILYGANKSDVIEQSDEIKGAPASPHQLGQNALHIAAESGHSCVIRLLLGSLTLIAFDCDQERVKAAASHMLSTESLRLKGHVSTKARCENMSFLLSSRNQYYLGRSVPDLLSGTNYLGDTPLHVAARQFFLHFAFSDLAYSDPLQSPECFHILDIDKDFADACAQNTQHREPKSEASCRAISDAPLSEVVVINDLDFSDHLLRRNGNTCMHFAGSRIEALSQRCLNSRAIRCVVALLSSGANTNALNVNGDTPLQVCFKLLANLISNQVSNIAGNTGGIKEWSEDIEWGSETTSAWGTTSSEAALLLEMCRVQSTLASCHPSPLFVTDLWAFQGANFQPMYFNRITYVAQALIDCGSDLRRPNRQGSSCLDIVDKCYHTIRSDAVNYSTFIRLKDKQRGREYLILDPKSPYSVISEVRHMISANESMENLTLVQTS